MLWQSMLFDLYAFICTLIYSKYFDFYSIKVFLYILFLFLISSKVVEFQIEKRYTKRFDIPKNQEFLLLI